MPSRTFARLATFALVAALSGCATIARVENLSDAGCRDTFRAALSTILAQQGETSELAGRLANQTVDDLARVDLGPRPFRIASPSGTDYEFFVEDRQPECMLRLYGRQKGFRSYINDITYIATQPLTACACRSG